MYKYGYTRFEFLGFELELNTYSKSRVCYYYISTYNKNRKMAHLDRVGWIYEFCTTSFKNKT